MRALALTVLSFAALAGCVTDPDEPPAPVCTLDTDCTSGQTCRDHQCFGGNAGTEFSAELFAPATRTDMLARAELKKLDVTQAGDVDVMFSRSIEISGRVLLRNADLASTSATVIFRRPSRISGASDYVVQVEALPGKLQGEVAFKARITPNEGDEKYEVSIYPDDGSAHAPPPGSPKPTSLAPPTVNTFKLTADWKAEFTLDRGGLKQLSGYVTDALGNGMDNMQVRAYRKRTSNGLSELVSSTALTKGGRYDLYVPLTDAASTVDLVVTPGQGVRAPSLTRKLVRVPETESLTAIAELGFIMYPVLPAIVPYQLPVVGPDGSGGKVPVNGATVTCTTVLSTGTTGDIVTYSAEASVTRGIAEVYLVPGALDKNRTYKISVIPLANAKQGTRWDAPVAVGPPVNGEGGMLADFELPARVQVTGRVLDADGKPAVGMAVRPWFSGAFMASLSPEAYQRVKQIPQPEDTTDETGAFNVYLDETVMAVSPVYDVELVPPSSSRLPRWSRDGVRLSNGSKVDLQDTPLPKTTLATGTVRDEDNNIVPEAEVHVYMHDGSGARLRTLAKSDKDGHVVLVLPSP